MYLYLIFQVRQAAANAYEMAANRQMIDVEKMASAAASAASQTAVEVALQHHRDQLEKLKKEALEKGIKIF